MILITLPTNQPFYGHYTGQPVLAGTSSQELEVLLVQTCSC